MTKINKNDFIEIGFTAKVKDGNIFDSNIEEDIKKENLPLKTKPFIFSIGKGMFLKSVEDFLVGKELGKKYEIELVPEQAFGKRDTKLIKIIPTKIYKQQNLNPVPGMMFNFDGQLGKVLSVSGGRVITDFNNPLSGKDIIYKVNVKRKVSDINEKVKAVLDFFFRQEFKFQINEKEKKIVVEADKQLKPLFEAFKTKFKEILGFDVEVKEINEKPKKEPQSQK